MESDSVLYGLLGRIHLLMRRAANRIIDIEYMRINKDYAREIVRVGVATGHAELIELCDRLRQAIKKLLSRLNLASTAVCFALSSL